VIRERFPAALRQKSGAKTKSEEAGRDAHSPASGFRYGLCEILGINVRAFPGPGESAVYRTRMAALGLKPRRQICQPLRGGVNEHGLQVLVETSEDESTDKNEKHAKRHLHGMAYRQGPLAPALQRFA